jgi:hypothetical protein
MQSEKKSTYYFQADANALGGILEQPAAAIIPSQASVALPAVGGFASARSEAFNLDQIVSCSSAYTRITGKEADKGGVSILATAVIENLNILEVITAERIVAQLSLHVPAGGGHRVASLAGSHFERLRFCGEDVSPKSNPRLTTPKPGARASHAGVAWPEFEEIAAIQADKLIAGVVGGNGWNDFGWVPARYEWMTNRDAGRNRECVLCSFVDAVEPPVQVATRGHLVEIPEFGRIFLGELLVTPTSIQLSMLRAELGCAVQGKVGAGVVAMGGHTVPPADS